MRGKRRDELVAEYLRGGTSYREMESKYGISSSTLQRWVEAAGKKRDGEAEPVDGSEQEEQRAKDTEAENRRLREELRKAHLHNELLNAMIDIAEEQFDIPIRKKRGARR